MGVIRLLCPSPLTGSLPSSLLWCLELNVVFKSRGDQREHCISCTLLCKVWSSGEVSTDTGRSQSLKTGNSSLLHDLNHRGWSEKLFSCRLFFPLTAFLDLDKMPLLMQTWIVSPTPAILIWLLPNLALQKWSWLQLEALPLNGAQNCGGSYLQAGNKQL